MKELCIGNRDGKHILFNIGGGTVFQWHIQTHKGHITFWGLMRGSLDYFQWGSSFKILNLMFSWRTYGKPKRPNPRRTLYFNRGRYRREVAERVTSYDREGYYDIALRIRHNYNVETIWPVKKFKGLEHSWLIQDIVRLEKVQA